ncbi:MULTISPECIES: hypothetical protein [unclassified Shinella]|uniref:hypothetical protein n=1 Tax=unclassified Shinella TaxID=2643062 RepID=UPI00234E39EA|nr:MULTISPECIES: hypothetical protein [unclassified Shinella]MCO5154017.1 hypothetical protein [Shinella sp.]MDC7266936.1 hypothetical protein [Shinella sp. HY16]MDC7273833.1 hypothetical protein [Shinella sp. YZ44]
MSDTINSPKPTHPQVARAVFANEDFNLIRTAILYYLDSIKDQPETVKYSNLYHRLGRVT